LIWVLVIGALVAAYVRRRRNARAILARWEREEAIEDARLAKLAAERASDALGGARPAMPRPDVAGAASAVSIKVEHRGTWHTLH
jgi:hypothetical protein